VALAEAKEGTKKPANAIIKPNPITEAAIRAQIKMLHPPSYSDWKIRAVKQLQHTPIPANPPVIIN
jgi:hypothetical protein